jgi:hypothetical protein
VKSWEASISRVCHVGNTSRNSRKNDDGAIGIVKVWSSLLISRRRFLNSLNCAIFSLKSPSDHVFGSFRTSPPAFVKRKIVTEPSGFAVRRECASATRSLLHLKICFTVSSAFCFHSASRSDPSTFFACSTADQTRFSFRATSPSAATIASLAGWSWSPLRVRAPTLKTRRSMHRSPDELWLPEIHRAWAKNVSESNCGNEPIVYHSKIR